MVSHFGDYDTTETIVIPFNTFDSNDPSASVTITNLAAADIEIHKDGAVAQRSSDAGVTVTIDFDSITGNHIVSIDLSDNTDAGFYAAGSRYQVRMEGTTVDGGTINAWIGAFSIGCVLRPTTAGNKLDVSATGESGLDFANIKDATGPHTLTNITVPVVTTNTDVRGTDGANTTVPDAAGTAAVPGDAMNLAADAIKAVSFDESTAFPLKANDAAATQIARVGADGDTLETLSDQIDGVDTKQDTAQSDLDIVTGADGTTLATAQGNYAPNVVVPDAAGTAAVPGDAMTLAADAIKAVSYDESTAWPVTAPDAGATQIARTGADGDTLETLSDEVAAIPTTAMRGTDSAATETKQDTAQTDLDTLTDARGEPGQGAPGASEDFLTKIDYLYKQWRNKHDGDGSDEQLYADDSSTVDQKRTVSEAGGTVTKAEVVTGP